MKNFEIIWKEDLLLIYSFIKYLLGTNALPGND